MPAVAANAFTGPEFERQARALVGLVEVYANQVAASGVAGPGVTVDDLKRLPLARLQQLAMTMATKGVQTNRRTGADEFDRYDLNDPMGEGRGRG